MPNGKIHDNDSTSISDADVWGADDTMTNIADAEDNIDLTEYFMELHNKLHHISPSVQITAKIEFDELGEFIQMKFEEYEKMIA